MPRRKATTKAPAVTREQIISASAKLFRERGYEGTSLNAVAESVGVTPPALYWHFDSKADILFAFLMHSVETFIDDVSAAVDAEPDPPSKLRALAAAHTLGQLADVELAAAFDTLAFSASQLARALRPDQLAELQSKQRNYFDQCRHILEDGQRLGVFHVADVTTTTFAILNLCEFVTTWYRPGGSVSAQEVAKVHGELAVRMVSALPPSAPPTPPSNSD